jgi:hypothetical protein
MTVVSRKETAVRKSVLGASLLAILVALFAAPRATHAEVSVSFSFFHDTLAPHGRWVSTVSYGEVWAPAVSPGWVPYVNGEWIYTDYGWTWVADDPWGEIPYRYGTWGWTDLHGWVWVPGYVWAPAWVTWAYTNDYVGWAPVPPSFVLTASGYFGRPVVVRETLYVFVPARQFVGSRVSAIRLPASRNRAILTHARRVTTYEVSRGVVRNVGPAPARIERIAGRKIERQSARGANLQPVKVERSGLAKASRISVAAPQRPEKPKNVVRAQKPARKPQARGAKSTVSKASVKKSSVGKRPPAIDGSPRTKPETQRIARPTRLEKKAVTGTKTSAADRSQRVEKALGPSPERQAAARAPVAFRQKGQKAHKLKETKRKEPERRPDRKTETRGGV